MALKNTALYEFHASRLATFINFSGWNLPIQFEGVLAEHQWTRESASLFDVGHMAVFDISLSSVSSLQTLTPRNLHKLTPNHSEYSLLLNASGGIVDDCLITHVQTSTETLRIVSNASRTDVVAEALASAGVDAKHRSDLSLIAVQGPKAETALVSAGLNTQELNFMDFAELTSEWGTLGVSRSGYTGEDGFEIFAPLEVANGVAEAICAHEAVKPAGLGSRDSLRLEAGLCLYGNDLDEQTTPIEAGLRWTVDSDLAASGAFNGADVINNQLTDGTDRRRVGILGVTRKPIRPPAELRDLDGNVVGRVTSGTFGPSVSAAVAMGYVDASVAKNDSLIAIVRDKEVECTVAPLPFVRTNYKVTK